ncbi:biotin carboxylase N-terminal domain-containing protein [uncultured Agrobacterium sp.]|uniref:acetyl/propionyl/methylcrotonyl-CoA carboxylase subunit alpha n=1 Tax=uncultured Agrobacterium sp. TaxID=157277 RepID=UPI0025869B58|nr:biotin carboxylase N-terminal domain-containing protein [uncultured Agrobacterium sp.]
MLDSLLIANRGEIARRIIRTARKLGIRTIAVHSDVDAAAPFVREADQAICIGTASAKESYLRGDRIIEAALQAGARAIHPGYGFLSENADFAESVTGAGLIWVGAPPSAIRAMGLKDEAKRRMVAANVPVTPGYFGESQSPEHLKKEADKIGYPVLIKAVAGGGGKGMRRVNASAGFDSALSSCKREASASFGDDRVLLEKYVPSPRHIEVQIFGDSFGNVVHLFERDCSLQRRHQKVIEEAPAPGMDAVTRNAVCTAAVEAARAVGYVGAGTIEFIADASEGLRPDRIWFMEMNTRLQVEHPVTEAITGQDLVEWQLRIASGGPLPLRQDEIVMDGWAVEARLYAENPSNGFLPSIGKLDHLRLPDTIRVDSGVEEKGEVSPYYDPMIAKLIAKRKTRRQAIETLADAVASVEIWPVKTNAAFLVRTLKCPDFLSGAVDTGFIERHLDALVPSPEAGPHVLQAAAKALLAEQRNGSWEQLRGFRLNGKTSRRVEIVVAGQPHMVEIEDGERSESVSNGVLFIDGEAWPIGWRRAGNKGQAGEGAGGMISSPMPGQVTALFVSKGDAVKRGQQLIIIEAMKMEQTLTAPFDGRVMEVRASEGAQIAEGTTLLQIEKEG